MFNINVGFLGDRVTEEQLDEDLVQRAIHLLISLDVG
jgi:hypothetical protein